MLNVLSIAIILREHHLTRFPAERSKTTFKQSLPLMDLNLGKIENNC